MSADAAIGALTDIARQRRQHVAARQSGAKPLLAFVIDGAVITFVDITATKELEAHLRRA